MKLDEVLGIISTSLGVVSSLGTTPGVNLIPYVNAVSSAAGAIKLLVDAGKDYTPLALKLKNTFKKDAPPPTEEEVAALDADTKAELAKLGAMPAREGDEPE